MASVAFPSSPMLGQRYFHVDQMIDYIWNGTSWVALTPAQSCSFSATYSSTFTIALGSVLVVVPFDAKEWDYGTNFTVGAAAKFTAPITGKYSFVSTVVIQGIPDQKHYGIALTKNGSQWKTGNSGNNSGAAAVSVNVAAKGALSAGDTVQVVVFQSDIAAHTGGDSSIIDNFFGGFLTSI